LGGQVGGGNEVAGAAGAKEFEVRKIAALVLASAAGALAAATATASSPDTLVSNASWWERVTVTISGDGKPESCRYETSLDPAAGEACDVASGQAALAKRATSGPGELTKITFERRFTPGAAPIKANLQTGDTLLGGQVMALAIDAKGAVKNCRIVSQAGSMRPEYGCDDATAERFQASVSSAAGKQAAEREGYMTILVYGHAEHMV
jgi:hypothetical protein